MTFSHQSERLKRTLSNALDGASYESSRAEDDGRNFVVMARRSDGRRVGVRFRGVKQPPTARLSEGAALRLGSVKSGSGFPFLLLFPVLRRPEIGYARVRIEAGAATLEVVCQDAEWWEER